MVVPIKPIGPIKPVLAPAGQSTAPATDPNAKPPVAGQPAANGEPTGQQTAQPKPGEKVFNITTDKDPTGEFTKVFASDEQHAQQVYRQQGTAAGQFKGAELAQESIDTMVSMLAKNGIEEGRDYYVNGTIYTDNQVMAEDITDIINMQDWDKKRAVSRKHDDSNEYYVDLEAPKSKMPGKGNISKFKKSLNICREVLSSETATSEQKAQAKTVMDSIKTQLGTIIADSEPVSESTNTMTGKVHFNIDSERAYQHVMDKFGQSIEWAGDTMVADRKIWPAIEELALAAGGAAEEDYGTQGPDIEEAAPALVRGAAGLALGSVAAAGTPALMGILGPVLGLAVGATGAYNAAKMGMNSADAIWDWAAKKLGGGDNAEEFAMAHINAAMKNQPTFEYNGKTYEVKATPQQAKAAGVELRKVAENATAPIIDEAKGDTIEAYGARGMKNTPWRKSFKNVDALNKWAEANDAEVMGTRDLEHASRGNLSPAVDVDEAQNDYFKRRKDEEDRIAGTKAPARRKPRQTDYEKKRKEQAVEEEQVTEISDTLRNKYVTRASNDYGSSNFAARASKSHPGLEDYSKEQEERAKKRAAGLNRALSDKRLGRVEEGAELKQAKRKYNQAAKDANADQAGAGKKIDTMKKSLRQKDIDNKKEVAEGVAETLPMADAVKVLRHYGADNFKTTSNELHFYKQGRPFSVDLVLNSDATRSVTLSSLNSATRGLKGQGLPNKQVKEGQLNEYLVREGMPVKDVLVLNLFQDFDPAEGCAAHFPEFAQEPMWKQVVRKYAPIAKMLEKKLLAQKRPLTAAEAEAVEETWYDGSDAYDDMEIEYLVNIYDQQIDTLEALLAGNLTDEEFDEGVAEGEVAEAKHGLNKRVRIVSGPADCIGKIGTVSEVRRGAGAKKTYTVDYDYDGNTGRSKSVQLKAKDLRLVNDDITESIMDKKSTMTEGEKVKTKTGMIHKGTYGSEVDVNDDGSKKKKAAPKAATGTGKRGRPAKAAEPKTSKSNDPFGRVPDKAPKGKKGTVVKGKATKDDNLEEARETLKTAKGTIYKGGTYGTSYDVGDNVKKAPAKKSPTGQRGRPKKEVSYDDSVAKGAKDLQGMFGSKAPKKGSALDKLPKTKHKIKDSNVEEGLAHIRGLKQQITETIRQVQRLPIEKQNDQRVIDIVSRLEETVSKAVGNVLRESHETMAHILSRFPAEVKQFAAGGDLDDGDLYDALYDYYLLHGEMPYGVAKARTGDPLEWVSNRFAQDVGDHYETESVMDEASGAHMFMTGEIVYFDNRRGKVDRQEGNKVFVHTGNGEMDVFPADQTSLTRQGMIPTMKKNLGQIGRGIKGFMTGTQEESIEEADDDITVFEKEHTREELDAMSDEALADLASTEYSAEDMLQYDEQGALANRGEIIDVIMSYNADGEVDEGNQFSGALQKAKSTGQQEFDVDGKTYKVKEATPAPMADVALESLATMIRLAGLPKR